MLTLNVPDMTCGHCVGAVTKAVKSVDADAAVSTDLSAQTVTVESAAAPAALQAALEKAGYKATVGAR
jgi:copper chaperone